MKNRIVRYVLRKLGNGKNKIILKKLPIDEEYLSMNWGGRITNFQQEGEFLV